ncbi:MAG: hypothetical protein R3B99_17095 [Polyangiales bacterium]
MSKPLRSTKTTINARKLNPSPTHENHFVLRPESASTIGAITNTPPRIKSITKTIETPSKVYASVVVVRITALQSPESAVQRVGTGIERRPSFRCVANRHHPVPPRKSATTTNDAMLESGKSEGPAMGSPIIPLDNAFVSAV